MRPVFDPTGGPDVLVEKMIGTAYETVKRVYCHLPEIRRLDGVLTEIPILAQTSADNALAVALPPILAQMDEKVQAAAGWAGEAEASAEAAAQSALAATKVNMMFPFTSDVSQMIYDVTVISGQTDVNTVGMALWVGGAIEFDFTILSATTFMLNNATAYPDNTQMRVILNAHFNDLVHGFDQLLGALEQEYKDAAALNGRWCGVHVVPPTTRLDGSPLQDADEYQNRSNKLRYSWAGTAWVALNSSAQQLEERLASPHGTGNIGHNQTPIAAAVGSLAKVVAGLEVSLWQYDNYVTVKPDPLNHLTWDWTPAVRQMFNEFDGVKRTNFRIPFIARCGNVKIEDKGNWSISGSGGFVKTTANSQFELYRCPNVSFQHLNLNGNIAWDEATNGSIKPGSSRTAYACGIYAQQCNNIRMANCDIYDYANDPISIRGKYSGLPGSINSTLIAPSVGVTVTDCNIYNYRNTAVYFGGVRDARITHNKMYTTDDFGYIRGNGIYLVDWNDNVLCFDNGMDRIGDNGIGVGEVKNPLAQNKNINLISNHIERCVYMSILVAGGEDVLVFDNTLIKGMMQRDLLPEAFLIPGNPGALQIRGGNTSKAKRVRAISNTVEDSYQRGVYVFDDAAVTKENWSEGIEVASNIVRKSRLENIYVNMAIPVTISHNQASDGDTIGIFASGAHSLFMNKAWRNVNHGILSSQLNTFAGQAQNPDIASNQCWENGANGLQVLGGPLVRASPPSPSITRNKCWANGFSGTSLGSKSGLRANSLYQPTIEGNECWDNFGPGLLIDSCTDYVAERSNKLRNNGWDTTLPQIQRAGIYINCTDTAFKIGRLMSNKMFAGDYQQVGYASAVDTTGSLICIGNEADLHPMVPQNVARKSWTQIYNNQ